MSGPHFSDPTIMADVCDGHVFKNHPVFRSSETALQIILYYDEFTAVNPMAPTSRKHKIGENGIVLLFCQITLHCIYMHDIDLPLL